MKLNKHSAVVFFLISLLINYTYNLFVIGYFLLCGLFIKSSGIYCLTAGIVDSIIFMGIFNYSDKFNLFKEEGERIKGDFFNLAILSVMLTFAKTISFYNIFNIDLPLTFYNVSLIVLIFVQFLLLPLLVAELEEQFDENLRNSRGEKNERS